MVKLHDLGLTANKWRWELSLVLRDSKNSALVHYTSASQLCHLMAPTENDNICEAYWGKLGMFFIYHKIMTWKIKHKVLQMILNTNLV